MQAIQVTTEKSGDSRIVRIPEEYFREMEIPEDDSVHISFTNQSVVISKDKILTLKERLIEFYGEGYEEKCRKDCEEFYRELKEIEWGPPVGNEIW